MKMIGLPTFAFDKCFLALTSVDPNRFYVAEVVIGKVAKLGFRKIRICCSKEIS